MPWMLRMTVDYFKDCHYTAIAVLLFMEHVLVFLAAVAVFISAYRAARLRPSVRRNRKRNSTIPPLALPEM